MKTLHQFLDLCAYWWHRLTTSRYVLYLERENQRLKEENGNLWRSVWGIQGRSAPQPAREAVGPAVAEAPAKVLERNLAAIRPKSWRGATVREMPADADLERQRVKAMANQLNSIREELIEETKRERRTQSEQESGYAITEAGEGPVQVEEKHA